MDEPLVGGNTSAVVRRGPGVARLVRAFHGATVGFRAPAGARWWRMPGAPEDGDVVCHNDRAPYNTVLEDARRGVPALVAVVGTEHAEGPLRDRAWVLANQATLAAALA